MNVQLTPSITANNYRKQGLNFGSKGSTFILEQGTIFQEAPMYYGDMFCKTYGTTFDKVKLNIIDGIRRLRELFEEFQDIPHADVHIKGNGGGNAKITIVPSSEVTAQYRYTERNPEQLKPKEIDVDLANVLPEADNAEMGAARARKAASNYEQDLQKLGIEL